MKHPIALLVTIVLILAACAPAATPAPTQAPAAPQPAQPAAPAAKPTSAPAPTQAPAAQPVIPTQALIPTAVPAAPQPTQPPLGTGAPELRPPQSGGLVNPPTIIPTQAGSNSVTSSQSTVNVFRDPASGLIAQYPAEWPQNPTFGSLQIQRIELSNLNQPAGHNATILIDVCKNRSDLLAWVKQQLPTGSLMLDSNYLEGGWENLTDYNAKLNGLPAIFVYQPEHGSGTAAMAALFAAVGQNFYQFTYHGDIPDDPANRLAYLRLLNTVVLSGTTTTGLVLPSTAFTTGIDLTQIK